MDKKDLAAPENNGRHWANIHYSLQREPVHGTMNNINIPNVFTRDYEIPQTSGTMRK